MLVAIALLGLVLKCCPDSKLAIKINSCWEKCRCLRRDNKVQQSDTSDNERQNNYRINDSSATDRSDKKMISVPETVITAPVRVKRRLPT